MGRHRHFRGTRLVGSVLGTLFGLLLVAILLAPRLISQGYYRALVATALAEASGAQTTVEGPVTLQLLPRPFLTVDGLQLDSGQGGYRAHIQRVSVTLALGPLLQGRLAVDALQIEHTAITVDLSEETSPPPSISRLALVQRLQAHVEDLRLDLRRGPHTPSVAVHVADLELRKDELSDRLSLRASGTVADHGFSLRMALDRISEGADSTRPLPLVIEISTAAAQLSLTGTVTDPARGATLDLQLRGQAPRTGMLLRLAGLPSPDLGPMQLKAQLSGPITAPSLSQIQLSVMNPPAIAIHAHGSTGDLWTLQDTDIAFSGQLRDPAVLGALLPAGIPSLARLEMQGSLRRDGAGRLWRVEDLDGEAETSQGLHVHLSGSTGLSPAPAFTDMALRVQLSAPSTAAARPLFFDRMPELGPVRGTARLAATGDALAVNDIDLHIGEESRTVLGVRGRIARVPLAPGIPNSGIALDLQLRAANTQALAKALDHPLPELGPISLSGHFSGSARRSELKALSLRAGTEKTLAIEAHGWLRMGDLESDEPIEELEIRLQAKAIATRSIAHALGRTLPELGPVSLSTLVVGTQAEPRATQLKLVWGRPSGLRLQAEGHIGRLSLTEPVLRGIRLRVVARAPDTASLRHLVDLRGLPDKLGPWNARFSLTGTSNRLRAPDLELDVGRAASLQMKARGALERIQTTPVLKWQGLRLQLKLTGPTTRALARDLGYALPELGALRGSAQLVGGGQSMALEDIRLALGAREARPLVLTTGKIGDLLRLDALSLRTRIDIPYRKLLEPSTRATFPKDARIEGELKLSRRHGIFSAERFTLNSRGTPDHSFYLRGTVEDLKGLAGLDAKIDFQARDTATLGRLLGKRWPPLPSISGHGAVHGKRGEARFEGRLRLGRTEATTRARLTLANARPRLQGTFQIPKLYLSDFRTTDLAPQTARASPPPTGGQKPTHKQGPLFSRTPIHFDRLHLLDLSVDLAVDQVMGVQGHVGDLHATIAVEDGRLAVHPARLVYQGGDVAFRLAIDAREKTARQSLELTADALSLGQLLGEIEDRPPAGGTLGVAARLSSSGSSPHQMASNLNGDLDLFVVDGKLLQTYMSLFVGNYLRWAITATVKPRSYSDIECGAIGLVAKDGQVESTLLFVDGEDLSMRGKLSLDLRQETIEAVLLPKAKKSFWAVANPVRLSGPILDPTVQALSTQSAINAIGTVGELVVAPYLYLADKIGGALWDKSSKKKRKKRIQKCLKRAAETAQSP